MLAWDLLWRAIFEAGRDGLLTQGVQCGTLKSPVLSPASCYLLDMNEIWKNIDGYEGLYQVSNQGRIKSFYHWGYKPEGRIMKTSPGGRGYSIVRLRRDNKDKTHFVHRLVATAFLGMPLETNAQCHHKNCIKTDNRVENLVWVSGKYNMQHRKIAELKNCYVLPI